MNEQGTEWFEKLKAFLIECRDKRPLITRNDLQTVEEMQCRIIGGSLIGWLKEHGPNLLQERAMLAGLEDMEKDPFIVFTSEQPGLIAANEILSGGQSTIVFLYHDEYSAWLESNPDTNYQWHIHTWSFFAPLDPTTVQRAKKYPLTAGEAYWLHKEGTMCGPLFGRGGDHHPNKPTFYGLSINCTNTSN